MGEGTEKVLMLSGSGRMGTAGRAGFISDTSSEEGQHVPTNGVPVKFQLNPFPPTLTAYERLKSRHRWRNKEETNPVSKHNSSPRRGGSAFRRGPGGLNLARDKGE